jgi:hypothetical protein
VAVWLVGSVPVAGATMTTTTTTTTSRVVRSTFVTPDETAPRWWPGFPTARRIVTEGSGRGVVVVAAAADEPAVVAFAALPAVHRRRPSSREVAECRGGEEEQEEWRLCGSLQLLSGGGAVFEQQAAVNAVGRGEDGGRDEEEMTWAVYMVATDARGNIQQLPTRLSASADEAPPVLARQHSSTTSALAAVLIEPWETDAAATAAAGERCGVGLDTRAQCRLDTAATDLTPNATA